MRARALILLVPLVTTLSACGSNNTPTTPTAPTQTFTDSFSGILTPQARIAHLFTTQAGGNVDITLVSVSPLNTLAIGVGGGTWDGSVCTVPLGGLRNDDMREGSVLTGSVTSAGTYCVLVYDSGNVQDDVNYTVQVLHP